MHKFISTALFVLVFAMLAANSNAQIAIVYKRMDEHNKALQTLKANVTMVKTNTQLGESDTSVGSTQYITKIAGKGKMYVRIDWTKPVEEQIAVIGDDYELYRPRLNQVITGRTNSAKNNASVGGALSFMNMSKDQLKANYLVTYLGEENINGGIQTWHLQLTPKIATSYKQAELWVDGDGMPRQAKVTEQNNDTTGILLANIKKNEKIDTKVFKLIYPSSAKKIKA